MNRKMKDARYSNISVRCNEAEKELLNSKAKEAGMTVSKFMLKAAVMGSDGLQRDLKKKKRITKICEIHTLLNELPDSPEVRAIHKEVDELCNL